MALPLPYGLLFTSRIASSRLSALITHSTGPNISVLYTVMSARTSPRMVGPTKLPRSYRRTCIERPSRTRLAPWSTPLCTSEHTRSFACGVMRGPRSASASQPALTRSVWALATRSGSQLYASPTRTATEIAMQRCPAAPKAAPVRALMECCLLASGSTTAWFFAPRFAWTRLPWAVARAKMYSPAGLEPTNEMALMAACSHMKFTASCVP
mmetsp:Transcript_21293/g.36559  ORF Transcript_21293/g.36559 Transcript_21293/m.36559 type:complete len:211 (+) Transcript_21293:917-1549(+)